MTSSPCRHRDLVCVCDVTGVFGGVARGGSTSVGMGVGVDESVVVGAAVGVDRDVEVTIGSVW